MITGQPFEEFKSRRHFGSLDGLRFIAVLAVIWHHTASSAFLNIYLAQQGRTGVTLFFAISGFLITTLLLREKEKYGYISLKNFYMRRTLRIFPLYYTVLLIYIAAVYFLEKDPGRATDFYNNLIYFATYTTNFFVSTHAYGTIFYFAWSLATEEQFYLVWPWFEKYFKTITKIIILSVLIVLIYMAYKENNPLPFFTTGGVIDTILLRIMPAICFGVLLAHTFNNPKSFNLVYMLFGSKWSSLVVFLVALVYLSLPAPSVLLVHLLMALIVLSCVIREDHVIASFLKWRPIAWMGIVSYGMYLMHMLCYNLIKILSQKIGINDHLFNFIGTTILTVIVASISYKYYEAYFLRLKKRYSTAETIPKSL